MLQDKLIRRLLMAMVALVALILAVNFAGGTLATLIVFALFMPAMFPAGTLLAVVVGAAIGASAGHYTGLVQHQRWHRNGASTAPEPSAQRSVIVGALLGALLAYAATALWIWGAFDRGI